MPTTLTGLILFVVLLLPGIAYVVGRERHTSVQQFSAFRETAVVVAASVSFELIVLVVFAVIRTVWPGLTPDVGALVRNSNAYLRGEGGHAGHYGQVAVWAVVLLGLAIVLAYTATFRRIRKRFGKYPHESTTSAWWILFDTWLEGRDVHVGCNLDDGSYVEGKVGSFSRDSEETSERDLILSQPILYRSPGSPDAVSYEASAVCISAGKIVTMFVTYIGGVQVTSEEAGAAAGAAAQAATEEAGSLVAAPS
jgi:Family of unknown function (DUF6338)